MKRVKCFLIALLLPVIFVYSACDSGPSKLTVTFHYNYVGATEYHVTQIDANTHVTVPADPEREDWKFLGWFLNQTATTPADFGRLITTNTTFYAGWEQSAFTITYDPNYPDAELTTAIVALGARPIQPPNPVPWGNGVIFGGWFTEPSCENQYLFESDIYADITLYALWEELPDSGEDPDINKVNIMFLNNYGEGEIYYENTIIRGRRITRPATPVRSGYAFLGWFTDAANAALYDFDTSVNDDLILYAKWLMIWTFEAEYTDLDNIEGRGYSGEKNGIEIIEADTSNRGASNGNYVSYLYDDGITLTFEIEASEAVESAVLVLRLAIEMLHVAITNDMFLVMVNEEAPLQYEEITFASITAPFANYSITSSLSLKKGLNTVSLIVNNSTHMIGTMYATAPLVDCVYIYTDTELSWIPRTDNFA